MFTITQSVAEYGQLLSEASQRHLGDVFLRLTHASPATYFVVFAVALGIIWLISRLLDAA